MDEQVKARGAGVQLGLYLFIALVMAPIAIGALASYPDPAWYFGLALAIAEVLILYSAYDLLRKSRLKNRENKIRQLDMEVEAFGRKPQASKAQVISPLTHSENTAEQNVTVVAEATPSAPEEHKSETNEDSLLADWHYTPEEWRTFMKIEQKIVTGESILLIVLITAAVAWTLHDDKDESWTFSIVFAIAFALIFILLKNYLKKGFINVNSGRGVRALISRRSIVLNGKLFNLTDETRHLWKVDVIEKHGVMMVEFTYKWQTRQRETQDEIRLPVPAGKLDEANELVTRMAP
jgi:hypothetical protein